MTDKEAMQMALDALDNVYTTSNEAFHRSAAQALLAALAQPEPESDNNCGDPECDVCV